MDATLVTPALQQVNTDADFSIKKHSADSAAVAGTRTDRSAAPVSLVTNRSFYIIRLETLSKDTF